MRDRRVQTDMKNSLKNLVVVVVLLGRTLSNLNLKPFRIFNPNSKQAIEDFWSAVHNMNESLQLTDMTDSQS